MIERCYGEKTYKNSTYEDVVVDNDWLLYENYCDWMHNESNFEKWKTIPYSSVDKDLLERGNRIYSKDTCLLVPPRVNSLFVKCDKKRTDLPIGVYLEPRSVVNPYVAYCSSTSINDKKHNIGCYPTLEDAFYAYKNYKEKVIKRIADEEYALGNITERCRDAMYTYEVEITD